MTRVLVSDMETDGDIGSEGSRKGLARPGIPKSDLVEPDGGSGDSDPADGSPTDGSPADSIRDALLDYQDTLLEQQDPGGRVEAEDEVERCSRWSRRVGGIKSTNI